MIHSMKIFFFLVGAVLCMSGTRYSEDMRFVAYTANASDVSMFWKNEKNEIFGSIQHLKEFIELRGHSLDFAMNGGMYMENRAPLGLYIENGQQLAPINLKSATGNFYLKPNGVFYITDDDRAGVIESGAFSGNNMKFATQSGPMLVIDGGIHPSFREGSTNLNIRNGVGILPDGRVLFAISTEQVNLYDFAKYFQDRHCANALYLDGFVSRAYIPSQGLLQLGGDFGVLIGVTKK